MQVVEVALFMELPKELVALVEVEMVEIIMTTQLLETLIQAEAAEVLAVTLLVMVQQVVQELLYFVTQTLEQLLSAQA
jgi:hypothetical protein